MQTPDLIKVLAKGLEPVRSGEARRRLRLAIALGMPVSVISMMASIGVNPELAAILGNPLFWMKVAFPLALAIPGVYLVDRLARPGAALGRLPACMTVVVGILWLLGALFFTGTAADLRAQMLFGDTWLVCPFIVLGLALPVLGAALWALRGLAPTRLRLAGFAAGLLAGALGAFVYAWHCPELSVPFVAVWYVAGIGLAGVCGAMLGERVLRW